MSYGLPIITTDVWANPEMVEDGEDGFLIEKNTLLNYYDKDYIPKWGSRNFLQILKQKKPDKRLIRDLVEKMQILIEDNKLRKRMGLASYRKIKNGKFSISKRNRKLKKIFDESLI